MLQRLQAVKLFWNQRVFGFRNRLPCSLDFHRGFEVPCRPPISEQHRPVRAADSPFR
jgi:hypothetical protein